MPFLSGGLIHSFSARYRSAKGLVGTLRLAGGLLEAVAVGTFQRFSLFGGRGGRGSLFRLAGIVSHLPLRGKLGWMTP